MKLRAESKNAAWNFGHVRLFDSGGQLILHFDLGSKAAFPVIPVPVPGTGNGIRDAQSAYAPMNLKTLSYK